MKHFLLIVVLLFFIDEKGGSQNISINTTGVVADASSILDISATNKGLLIPRVSLASNTDATTIATPVTSLLVYNTNAAMANGNGVGFYYNSGTSGSPVWVTFTANISGSSGGITMIGTKSAGTMNWNACSATCYNSTESGLTDWRMPTMGELKQALANGSPAFPGGLCACYVWTSDGAITGSSNTWGILYESSGAWSASSGSLDCRCVR